MPLLYNFYRLYSGCACENFCINTIVALSLFVIFPFFYDFWLLSWLITLLLEDIDKCYVEDIGYRVC